MHKTYYVQYSIGNSPNAWMDQELALLELAAVYIAKMPPVM